MKNLASDERPKLTASIAGILAKYPDMLKHSLPVKASPFIYRDPASIPRRETLYAGHYSRRFLSATFGIGGGGKSTLMITDALAMISGLPLLGHTATKPLRVWYVNLEDPADEIERRFAAAAKYHGIDPDILNQNLFMDSGRDQEFVVMKNAGKGVRIVEPVVASITKEMIDNRIDVLIVDPFISSHEVEENDNGKIQQVAAQFVRIANEANASVELVHHVNKSAGDGKGEVTADSGRGAGALKDKARSVRVINGMSADEASKAGVDSASRFDYFRIGNGKSNLKRRTGRSDWCQLISVNLDNGTRWGPGDSIGVATQWHWPSDTVLEESVSADQLATIKATIDAGQFKANSQSRDDWAGLVFSTVLGLDATDKAGRAGIAKLMAVMVKAGHFVEVDRKDEKDRKWKPFFEVRHLH